MKIEATVSLRIIYDTHEDDSFNPDAQLTHAINWLSNNGQLTGDSAATIDKLSISVATKNVPSMDVDFLLAYGDGTWELKRHQVALSTEDLHDEKGELDLRKLNDCIDTLLEDTYYDSDVVAMVPYWLSMGSQFGLDTSLGAPAPVLAEKAGDTPVSNVLDDHHCLVTPQEKTLDAHCISSTSGDDTPHS